MEVGSPVLSGQVLNLDDEQALCASSFQPIPVVTEITKGVKETFQIGTETQQYHFIMWLWTDAVETVSLLLFRAVSIKIKAML